MDGGAGATEPGGPIGGQAFADAVRWVIDVAEGGSRIISDQGGTTRWGISQRAYPDLDTANLTRDQAEEIYLRDYWKPIHGNALPPAVAFVVFDAAVNMGPSQAVKILQSVLRVQTDGILGPITLSAAKMFRPSYELVALFLELRLRFYDSLAAKYAHHRASAYGWRMRVFRLALEAGRWRSV